MSSLGRRLREERVRQGLQLSDIAKKTRIALRHLEAIEEERLDLLPAGYFRRSFLRQYADALGVTGSDVDLALQNIVAEPAPDELARAIMDRPVRPPQRPPRRLALAWAVPALLLIAGSGAFYWFKQRTPSVEEVAGTPPMAAPAIPTPPTVTPPADPLAGVSQPPAQPAAPVQPNPAPALTPQPASPPVQASTTPSQPPAATPGSERLSLNLEALEQTWISLAAEGKTVFTGVLSKGETKTIEGAEQARLVVGNAGGLEVRWNGKTIEPIGPKGHIREVVFTRENYRIRVLRKPES